jgi:hypothetical protein
MGRTLEVIEEFTGMRVDGRAKIRIGHGER